MKILHVIASMDPKGGGVAEAIRNIVAEHDKIGHYTEIVSLDAADASFLMSEKLKVNSLGPASNLWSYGSKLVPWLMQNVQNFDIVVVHGLWLFNSYAVNKVIGQLSRHRTGKVPKVAVMPHGMLDPFFQKADGRRLKAIRNWLYWKLIEGSVVNNADALLFTCEGELQLARIPFKPYNPKREINVGLGIPVVPNVEYNAFTTQYTQFRTEPFILFLSRINYKKGVDILIQGYEKLLAGGKKLPKLIIAGPGLDTSYGDGITKLVENNAILKESILFPGMLQGDMKWGAFAAAEAFILPSHQENFGIAVVEALASGTPVLITNQVNIWHEIAGAEAGLVDDDTLEGVIRLLEKWIKLSPEDKAKMKERAISAYENYFAIEPAAKKLSDELIKLAAAAD